MGVNGRECCSCSTVQTSKSDFPFRAIMAFLQFENISIYSCSHREEFLKTICQIITGCFQATGWPGVVSVMANWFDKVNITKNIKIGMKKNISQLTKLT